LRCKPGKRRVSGLNLGEVGVTDSLMAYRSTYSLNTIKLLEFWSKVK